MFATSNFAVSIALFLLVVLALLTVLLVTCKAVQVWRGAVAGRRFLASFRAAGSVQLAAQLPRDASPFGRVAAAGLGTLQHAPERREALERNLRHEVLREKHRLEAGLAALSFIRNAAPFVGLLGTVWGSAAALQEAGFAGGGNFAMVAAPIGAALEVTGIGLLVAMPAMLAFRFFRRRVQRLLAELDDFQQEFLAHAHAHAHADAPRVVRRGRDVTVQRPFVVVTARNAS